MTTWKKLKPGAGRGGWGRDTRAEFAVTRSRSGGRAASLVIPGDAPEAKADRASVYSDGNGKLAFAFGDRGDFGVYATGPAARARKVTIPAAMADRIPYGTTDVSLTRDGDMLVLDLSRIGAA